MIQQYLKRFNVIDEQYVRSDKHMHTTWSDGAGSVAQVLGEAVRLQLTHIAIVDHVRAKSAYFPGYFKEIENASRRFNVKVLAGYEAKIKNFSGDIGIPDAAVNAAQIRIASVHRMPIGRKLYDPNQFKREICHQIELELSVAAIKKKQFDILGHPGGMSLLIYNDFPLEYFEEIIIECKKNDIAFELNSRYHCSILKGLKGLLKEYNPLVSLGSDTHNIGDVERSLSVVKGMFSDE